MRLFADKCKVEVKGLNIVCCGEGQLAERLNKYCVSLLSGNPEALKQFVPCQSRGSQVMWSLSAMWSLLPRPYIPTSQKCLTLGNQTSIPVIYLFNGIYNKLCIPVYPIPVTSFTTYCLYHFSIFTYRFKFQFKNLFSIIYYFSLSSSPSLPFNLSLPLTLTFFLFFPLIYRNFYLNFFILFLFFHLKY